MNPVPLIVLPSGDATPWSPNWSHAGVSGDRTENAPLAGSMVPVAIVSPICIETEVPDWMTVIPETTSHPGGDNTRSMSQLAVISTSARAGRALASVVAMTRPSATRRPEHVLERAPATPRAIASFPLRPARYSGHPAQVKQILAGTSDVRAESG